MYKLFINIVFVGILYVSLGAPQYEIHDGNCSKALVKDLVFQKQVHMLKIPFVVREDTENWYGDHKIYCMTAVSERPAVKNSTVEIVEGGLNHTFVTFKLKSAKGQGLEYMISVYADTSTKATK